MAEQSIESSQPRSAIMSYCWIALRAVVAYSAASLVAMFVLFPPVFFISPPMALGLAIYTAGLAGGPAIAALAIVRMTPLWRGVTDIVAGAVIGALLPLLLDQLGGHRMDFDPSHILLLGRFALAGAAGGLTYWLAKGCPKSARARRNAVE